MSSSVDNRVVEMTFKNSEFERKMAETMKSMDKFKQSLDFSGAKRGVEELSSSVGRFNLGNIGASIEGVSGKFLALSTIAVTTLATITSHALRAGADIVKSLSLDQVTAGFAEYETNMNSIQTILANTKSDGSTLEDVNAALDKLNEYSDQTIYNFSQMAKNIGTFTAAGVNLDDSVNAIKGIANLAAISGSNSEQASTAMYQLSQALAAGKVNLMDWNSVVNAGMGGEVFKKALFETGKAMGTITDVPLTATFEEWEKAGGTFREQMEKGWLTADVLKNTLGAFSGDLDANALKMLGFSEAAAQEMVELGKLGISAATEVKTLTQLIGTVKESVASGWSKSFRIIFGDFEQAKATFTEFNTAIGGMVQKSADGRNKLLQGWSDLGGRTKLIEGLKNAFGTLADILGVIKTQFQRFFPPMTAERLYSLTAAFAEFFGRLRANEDFFDRLSTAFGAVFAAIDIGINVVKGIAGVFVDLFKHFSGGGAGKSVLDFIDRFALGIIELQMALVDGGGLDRFFEALTGKLIAFGEALKNPGQLLATIKDSITDFFKGINFGTFDGIADAVGRVQDLIKDIFNVDVQLPEGVLDFFSRFFETADENTSNSLSLAGGFDVLGKAVQIFGDILGGVADVITWVWDHLDEVGGFIVDVGGRLLDFVMHLGPNLQKAFMSDEFDKLLETIQTIALLLGGKGLADIGSKGLKVDMTGGSLSSLADLFDKLSDTVPNLKKNIDGLTGVFGAMQTSLKAEALQKIGVAIALITASVIALSFVDPDALGKALTALAGGFAQLVGAMAILNTMASGPKGAAGLSILATGMIAMATAVLVLSGAVAVMATMNWDELGRGLAGVTALLAIMTVTAMAMSGNTASLVGAGVGMIGMAVALTILAGALKLFALMSWEEIGKGMAVLLGSLLILSSALASMGPSVILIGPGLVAVAIALNLIGSALLIFSTMSWKEIGKGMVVLLGTLLIISSALASMGPGALLIGPGLIAVGIALNILGAALMIFGKMSWKAIGKAMVVLTGSLLILSAAMSSMIAGLPGAIAVGVMAASLLLLSQVLKEFANMSLKELGKGLLGMVAVLAAIGISAMLLSPAIGNILLLGVALLALGAGFALFGLGASLLAKAFEIIAVAGTAGINVLMYAIDQLLVRLPDMARSLAEALVEMAQYIIDAAPKLIAGLGKVIAALIKVIIEAIPGVTQAAQMYIEAFLETVRKASPDIVKTGFQLIMDFLKGIEDNIQEITATVLRIIAEFINGIAEAYPTLIDAAYNMLLEFLKGITRNIDEVIEQGLQLVASILTGIAKGIDDVVDAGGDIVVSIIEGAEKQYSKVITAGTNAVIKFIEGLGKNAIKLARAAADVVIEFINGLADAIDDKAPELRAAGKNLAKAILDGMTLGLASGAAGVIGKAGDLGEDILGAVANPFDWNSPSKTMIRLGKDIGAGLVIGFDKAETPVVSRATQFSDRVLAAFKGSLSKVPEQLGTMKELNPVITPVLDLSSVRKEATSMSSLFDATTAPIFNLPLSQAEALSAMEARLREVAEAEASGEPSEAATRSFTFTQINNSPKALSTATIYRQSKSMIEMTKKDLELV